MTRYYFFRAMMPLAGRFPRVFYPIAVAMARATWLVWPGHRNRVIGNMLPLCDGDPRRARRAARLAHSNIARYWVDVASVPHLNMDRFERDHITVIDEHHLAPLSLPGPVIIVSAHTGNPEFALQAIIRRGRRFTALVEDIKPRALANYLHRLRTAAGGTFEVASFSGIRACLEALKAGEVVGIVADRDLQGTGLCTRIAGRDVRLPRGPWELARRTNAVVIPVFASRDAGDHFSLRCMEAFRVARGDDPEADIACAVERWAALLDAQLRREPEQWAVLEDFWRVHACG